MKTEELQKKAAELRIETLKAISKAELPCLGSTMSVMEILTALYYGEIYGKTVVKIDQAKPGWDSQDYVVLSKSQAATVQYAILADKGFFDKSELDFIGQPNAMLTVKPNVKIPGIIVPGGSAGEGFSMAVGLAMSAKMDRKSNRVFAILGDGELQAGQIWEAAMSAAHYKLNNLVTFVDNNKMQSGGTIKAVMDIDPIQDKFEAFGWQVIQVRDGHDLDQILDALVRATTSNRRPVCLWCHTVSGKGVSFAEEKSYYHRSVLSEAELNVAVTNLEKLI